VTDGVLCDLLEDPAAFDAEAFRTLQAYEALEMLLGEGFRPVRTVYLA
jgi:hypothetical protein